MDAAPPSCRTRTGRHPPRRRRTARRRRSHSARRVPAPARTTGRIGHRTVIARRFIVARRPRRRRGCGTGRGRRDPVIVAVAGQVGGRRLDPLCLAGGSGGGRVVVVRSRLLGGRFSARKRIVGLGLEALVGLVGAPTAPVRVTAGATGTDAVLELVAVHATRARTSVRRDRGAALRAERGGRGGSVAGRAADLARLGGRHVPRIVPADGGVCTRHGRVHSAAHAPRQRRRHELLRQDDARPRPRPPAGHAVRGVRRDLLGTGLESSPRARSFATG